MDNNEEMMDPMMDPEMDPEMDNLIQEEDDEASVKTTDPRLQHPNLAEAKVTKDQIGKKGQFYFKDDEVNEPEARQENFFWSICLCICPTISWT